MMRVIIALQKQIVALVSVPRDERNHRRVNELMRLIDEINRR